MPHTKCFLRLVFFFLLGHWSFGSREETLWRPGVSAAGEGELSRWRDRDADAAAPQRDRRISEISRHSQGVRINAVLEFFFYNYSVRSPHINSFHCRRGYLPWRSSRPRLPSRHSGRRRTSWRRRATSFICCKEWVLTKKRKLNLLVIQCNNRSGKNLVRLI